MTKEDVDRCGKSVDSCGYMLEWYGRMHGGRIVEKKKLQNYIYVFPLATSSHFPSLEVLSYFRQ